MVTTGNNALRMAWRLTTTRLRSPFGVRGADVVLAQRLQQTGAGHARDDGKRNGAERKGRQNQMFQCIAQNDEVQGNN